MAEPRHREILYQVGRGLHEWSLVEMALARLFVDCAGHPNTDPHALFGAVINFDTRLTLCDRLMQSANLDPTEKEIWDKLSARLSKHYKKRHELAHFTLYREDREDVILPFLTTATIREPEKRLSAAQIKERIEKFKALQPALEWFGRVVVRKRMPFQAPYLPPLEEPPLVARLRELAIQSLAERQPRAKDPLD